MGDGKDLNLSKCPRTDLQRQCISYLGPVSPHHATLVNDHLQLIAPTYACEMASIDYNELKVDLFFFEP